MSNLLYFCVTAALAGFLFGFDTVVISGAEQTIQELWGLSDWTHGLATSMALWGTVLGALAGGIPTDRFGRRATLIGIGVLYLVSAIWSALASGPYTFMMARLIGGIGVGVSTVAAPLFIAEIAPPGRRGLLAGMFQFNIVLGILTAYLSNWLLRGMGENAWRWMLAAEAVPAAVYSVMSVSLPESPRWLIAKQGDHDAARATIRRVTPEIDDLAVDSLVKSIASSLETEKRSDLAALLSPRLRTAVLIAFLVAFFNQLSGINAVLYFAPRIFEWTGLGEQSALLQSVGIGFVNLIATMAGLWLIDRLGRKTLLVIGSIGYIGSLSLCSYAFATQNFELVPPCLFTFIAAHAMGQGAVIWVLISEIFPTEHRAAGQALGSSTHWVFAALITLVFPSVADSESIPPASIFGFFAIMMVLQLIWVLVMVPETKGVTLERMQSQLHKES